MGAVDSTALARGPVTLTGPTQLLLCAPCAFNVLSFQRIKNPEPLCWDDVLLYHRSHFYLPARLIVQDEAEGTPQ